MKAAKILFLVAALCPLAAAQMQLPALPALPEAREAVLPVIFLIYLFAFGRIADFLQSSGRPLSRKEVLLSPVAYILFAGVVLLAYFSSSYATPPQNTLIALGVYLVLLPLGIAVAAGAVVLHGIFRDRLPLLQALDLSAKIALAPLFDGLAGYWTAMAAAAVLVFISGASYWSSGGNLSLVTMDFLLLSAVFAVYFIFRAFTSHSSEAKASNTVSALTILAPSVLRVFFKDLACAALAHIPLAFFATCPLERVGSEVTLALSVGATLLLLVPAIPVIYALMVNALRVISALKVLAGKKASGRERAEAKGGR